MQTDVRAWLDQADPSYEAGLSVLASTGYDQGSLTWSLLQRGADSFTRSKLRALLEGVLISGAPAPRVTPMPTPAAMPADVAKPKPDAAIAALLDQRTEAKARLRAILDDADKADERRVLALGIKDTTDQLDRLYRPEAFPAPVEERGQAKPGKVWTVANVRTYVSLYRRRVRLQPDNPEEPRMLAYYETLLKHLQSTHEETLRTDL